MLKPHVLFVAAASAAEGGLHGRGPSEIMAAPSAPDGAGSFLVAQIPVQLHQIVPDAHLLLAQQIAFERA